MHRTLVPVFEITPNSRNWTAKVLLMRKHSPRQAQSNSTKYQRFLFIDKDKTQVQGIIYSPDINLMQNVLQVQETYFITNAKVGFMEPKYRMVTHMYQWVINRSTSICHVPSHECLPKELGTPQFTKFEYIPLSLNTRHFDRRKPMMLTLWNEVLFNEGTAIINTSDRMPIIEATGLNVSNFHGKQKTIHISLNLLTKRNI